MGYADWHFMAKDIKENPRGFLIGLLVIIIVVGGFFLALGIEKRQAKCLEEFKPLYGYAGTAASNMEQDKSKCSFSALIYNSFK